MHRSPAARRAPRSVRLQVERLDERLVLSAVGLPTVAPSYPTDPQFGRQRGLNDPADVDVDAPEAWRVTTGSAATIVAVIDSGIDLKSPEFKGRLWVNPEASKRGRPAYGWNFVRDNGNVQDDFGHGTHVAGILGASANDGQGIVGVDWNAKLMILKTLDAQGGGDPDDAADAVRFAADHGARVINASWATDEYSQDLYDAIAYADAKGVVVVTAAGNDASNLDVRPLFPATFDLPNILVVAAVDPSGGLASFSNYGASAVDVAAPGVDVYSTYTSKAKYTTLSGTSMSVPYVTGVVSLLAGLHPDWSAEQLVDRVKSTVRPLASLAGVTTSGGMVDAAQAVGVAGSGPHGDVYSAPPPTTQRVAARGLRPVRARAARATAAASFPPAAPAFRPGMMRAAAAS
ncbi:S8 family peptidase [Paludisphaera mucosa]|uniref:S8 family peptidase n=1 Tax=Paludisphaera mucosa TaxID=3030827 RepID=A0ABT6FGQ0_9BACT|nr:S8 family peptidase [Paludisphaera mucosa]MDG3006756.1 S8 family peptidase [Paludisphaera mucosa]